MRVNFRQFLTSATCFTGLFVLVFVFYSIRAYDEIRISTFSLKEFMQTIFVLSKRPLANYLVGASLFYFIFWKFLQNLLHSKKIQKRSVRVAKYIFDICNSLLNVLTISALSVFMLAVVQSPYCKIYQNIDEYGYLYMIASFIIAMLAIDTYYYWLHRFLHTRWLYKHFHSVHHISRSPTPWSTFAIAPLEQSLVYLFYLSLVCVLPMHKTVFIAYLFVGLIRQFIGHLGFEVFPKSTLDGWLKWNLTVTHHDMHHQYISCNYGLYFNLWDSLMKTNHKKYYEKFRNL
ncbi:MAG: sterol desaturase family protein [Deltaproteobacteria bacterium]|nr:sterol desaturase family protein [Deltaproteobacteria bacterium]